MRRGPQHSHSPPRAARVLEGALLFTFVAHAVAMVSMALLLLPGMPGGPQADDVLRVRYIAEHPWSWRLGWFPWQLTALSDVLLGVALVRTRWIPRAAAWLTLIVTLAALVPDQLGQILWMTRGVRLATEATQTGDLAAYLAFEGLVFRMVGIFGCIGYLLGALGWTWCFAAAGTWTRRLTWLSVATWATFAFAVMVYFLPSRLSPGAAWVSAANAVGFVLLQVWLIEVTHAVVGRSRPVERHGRYAAWCHPSAGAMGRLANYVANNHFARALGEWLPVLPLASDIRDVVYVNYLVDANRLKPFLPPGLEFQQLGPDGRFALFTFLTYRHGHFGPVFLGPLRKLLPSPVQSNWRIHVTDPLTGKRGVYFISTAISSTAHALAGRLFSEAVPMHVPKGAAVTCRTDGTIEVTLEPGIGSAPDVRATLRPSYERTLPADWVACFGDWLGFLSYCVPQDRALSAQPWYERITRQEVELGIPLEQCCRMEGQVDSRAARAIVGEDCQPICFHVAAVTFRFCGESYDVRAAPTA